MNKTVLTSFTILCLLSTLFLAILAFNTQPVKASGTIYIRPDGSVEGTDKIQRDGEVYTFIGTIYDFIVVQRSNITIDGNGYSLQGIEGGDGFTLSGVNNVTIKNTNIQGFACGILNKRYWDGEVYHYSSNNSISGNNVTNNTIGILLDSYSNYNSIVGNNITTNNDGIYLYCSSNNTIIGNNIIANNGSGVILLESSNDNVSRNNIKENKYGVYIKSSNNNSIYGNNITALGLGICLYDSSNNNHIYGNTIYGNTFGIHLQGSLNNRICGNNITTNITAYGFGIVFQYSSNNDIRENNIATNWFGIRLLYSNNNSISGNTITNNDVGILLTESSYNKFYHNNFIDNREHADLIDGGYANVWDDRYPSGGNYWGDYVGVDLYSGPYQNKPGSDGIGDVPYAVNVYDRYPLMCLFNALDAGVWGGVAYAVDVVSNSTVSDFLFDPSEGPVIRFNVTGVDGTAGFCRVTLPKQLLWAEEEQWVIRVGGEEVNYTLTLDENNTYLYFTYQHSTKTVLIQGTYVLPVFYNLNITSTEGGITDPASGTYTYVNGTTVFVTAIPESNYKLAYWELDGENVGSTNPIEVLIDFDHTLHAVFRLLTYNLTISAPTGGTTDPGPGIYTFVNGTLVSVTAIPDANYVLDYWELDGSNIGSDNPIDIRMDNNHTLLAVFVLRKYTLTITSTLGGTTDPPTGTYDYTAGSSVNATAIPNAGYSFDHWLLDGEERAENPITILMNANHTLEAVFVDDIPPEIGAPVQEPTENVEPYQNVTVTVNVTDLGTGVYNVTLWYSLDNGTTWMDINMEISTSTYQAIIPGYENCTWVTYKIIAYDNAGNPAINDNHGYHYKYHVIPEFPSILILPLLIIFIFVVAMLSKNKRCYSNKQLK